MKRSSGIILHPTSLPNDEGIGTIGKEAFAFIDWLKKTRTGVWQMLPIGPTGYGDSPYTSFSAFAGNPYLINLQDLCKKGFLEKKDFAEYKKIVQENTDPKRTDFGLIHYHKTKMLKKAAASLLHKIERDSSSKEELEMCIDSAYESSKFSSEKITVGWFRSQRIFPNSKQKR